MSRRPARPSFGKRDCQYSSFVPGYGDTPFDDSVVRWTPPCGTFEIYLDSAQDSIRIITVRKLDELATLFNGRDD